MKRDNERGVVLILTLMLLSILIVVVTQITHSTSINKHVSQNYVDDLQNSYALFSGRHIAELYLQADLERSADVDTLHEPWAQPMTKAIGSSTLTIAIEDESRRINISALVGSDNKVDKRTREMLTRLIVNLGHDESNAVAIVDYIDPDIEGDYEQGAKNAPLINKEELLQIKMPEEGVFYGKVVDEVAIKGIMDFITLWPRKRAAQTGQSGGTPGGGAPSGDAPGGGGSGGQPPAQRKQETPPRGGGAQPSPPRLGLININTAPKEVLMALSDKIDETIAGNIVAFREEVVSADGKETPRVFSKIDDLRQVEGMNEEIFNEIRPQVTVKSDTFTIRCAASSGSLKKEWIFAIQRGSDPKHPFTLLSSERFQESPSLPEPEQPE